MQHDLRKWRHGYPCRIAKIESVGTSAAMDGDLPDYSVPIALAGDLPDGSVPITRDWL